MYNKIILIGRITADPELKHTPSGTPAVRFTLAVARTFENKSGEKETDFIDIQAWRGLAETVVHHVSKGYLLAVDGRLQIRNYEDKQGNKRKAAEVVAENIRFLDRGSNQGQAQGSNQKPPEEYGQNIPFEQDDLPF